MAHFRGYSDKDIVEDRSKKMLPREYDTQEVDPIMREIFAPNPVTGKPQSDLHIIYSQNHNPMIAEYIKNTLANPMPEGARIDDPDAALEMTKSRLETVQEYAQRLQELVNK